MKTVILFPAVIFFFVISTDSFSQVFTLKGKIFDAVSGVLLPNANIVESKSEIGTITNPNGCFSLMLSPGQKDLIISLNGYKSLSHSIVLKNDTTIALSLESSNNLKIRQKSDAGQSASLSPLKKRR